jgi:hypothetical protein
MSELALQLIAENKAKHAEVKMLGCWIWAITKYDLSLYEILKYGSNYHNQRN